MKSIKWLGFAMAMLTLTACGSGEGYSGYDETLYIDWTGSVNGTLVVDATDDAFEFERDTGYLHFGNTTYTNAWVDDFADFWVDGIRIGGVYYVESIDGEVITALVSNRGYFIDLYGPESDLRWQETTILPIYALSSTKLTTNKSSFDQVQRIAQVSKDTVKGMGSAPLMAPNATKSARPLNSTGTLTKAE